MAGRAPSTCSNENYLAQVLRAVAKSTYDGSEILMSDIVDGIEKQDPAQIKHALTLLEALGALTFVGDKIQVRCITAARFLESIAMFVDEGGNSWNLSSDLQEQHFRRMTKSYEVIRQNNPCLCQQVLHRRRIVNVVIKSRKKRGWRFQTVYLHILHPKWDAYHLIGLSQKHTSETDEILIEKIMKQRLGLDPDEYVIDRNFRPAELKLVEVSESSGALTEYTYSIYFVERIRRSLSLNRLMVEGKGVFRWFTLEDIARKYGSQHEKIIFSTPTLMRHIGELDGREKDKELPLTKVSVDDVRQSIQVGTELGKRVTLSELIRWAIITLILIAGVRLAFWQFPDLNQEIPVLGNLANIADILALLPIVMALVASLFKD